MNISNLSSSASEFNNSINPDVNFYIPNQLINDIGQILFKGNNIEEVANNLINDIKNKRNNNINVSTMPGLDNNVYGSNYFKFEMGLDPIYFLLSYKELDSNCLIVIRKEKDDYKVDYLKKNKENTEIFLFKSDQTEITIKNIIDQDLFELEEYKDCEFSVVFMRIGVSSQKISFQDSDITIEEDGIQCYHKELFGKTTAPFHHEKQMGASDGRCGYYAFNAFIGSHTELKKFTEIIKEIIYLEIDEETTSINDILRQIHPIKENNELDTTNYLGQDPDLIAKVIKRYLISNSSEAIVEIKGVEINNSPDIITNGWNEIDNIVADLLKNQCDRFISGITSPYENHFFTYRKDEDDHWWKIDSLMKNQVSFEDLNSVVSDLKKDYGNSNGTQLYFIYTRNKINQVDDDKLNLVGKLV